MDQSDVSSVSHHYLAEIKYPTIPDIISIDKIFNVLQKIRTTSKPLFYKWQPLLKPKNGEIYLEQKYPLTRDPINGDQFSIVDDGYLWSSIPKPEVCEYQNQQIEIFKWTEGYSPGDRFFSISKTEYRLKVPNNVLFLIHYLSIKDQNVPVKTALPSTKISPVYLQQQFFLQLKHQMTQINNGTNRPVNPVRQPLPSSSLSKVNNYSQRPVPASTSSHHVPTRNPNDPLIAIESSIDIFDPFSDYEAAQYRLILIKPFLHKFLESSSSIPMPRKLSNLPQGLENDLIAAIKKNISMEQDRSDQLKKTLSENIQSFKREQKEFWGKFRELDQLEFDENGVEFSNIICNKMIEKEEAEILFTSL